jgi:para-aminobenzoate synthetase component 1
VRVSEFEQTLNIWGRDRVPFLFVVDFEMKKPIAIKLSDVNTADILYDLNGFSNFTRDGQAKPSVNISKYPIKYSSYEEKFNLVLAHLQRGDSFLTNLTIKTEIELSLSLKEIFKFSNARYKLLYKNEFLVFSPEIFIRIDERNIHAYPMKGTISSSVPDAARLILSDEKELAEHVTIVDLIRNDLSLVSENVQVSRFRYLEKLLTIQALWCRWFIIKT